MANDHYDILEISPEATEDEIKRAYALKRREVEKERDEEKLKRLLEARSTLLDAKARSDYDAFQQCGDEIAQLNEQVLAAQDQEDWDEAVRLLKRISVLIPSAIVPLNLLGIAYLNKGDPVESIRVIDRVTTYAPETALYWRNAGFAYAVLGDMCADLDGTDLLYCLCPECGDKTSFTKTKAYVQVHCSKCGHSYRSFADTCDHYYFEARNRLRMAIDLEPLYAAAYLEIARTYCREGNYTEAIIWAEHCINADGQVDINDLDDLFTLCLIYVLADKPQQMYNTVARMMPLSDHEDYQEYLSWRFKGLANDSYNKRMFQHCSYWQRCVTNCNPRDHEAEEALKYIESVADAEAEWERFVNDENVIGPFRQRASMRLTFVIRQDDDQDDFDDMINNIFEELGNYLTSNVYESVLHVKSQYRGTYLFDQPFYDEIHRTATPKPIYSPPISNSTWNSSSSTTKSGCAIPVLLGIAAIVLRIVYSIP